VAEAEEAAEVEEVHTDAQEVAVVDIASEAMVIAALAVTGTAQGLGALEEGIAHSATTTHFEAT
jgi:hypothetical protein